MMGLHSVSVGVMSVPQWMTYWYAAAAVCVWSHRLPRTLLRLHEGLVAY